MRVNLPVSNIEHPAPEDEAPVFRAAHDDRSLARVNLSPASDRVELVFHLSLPPLAGQDSDWRASISLGANELKYVEVVPLFTQIIARIQATRDHHSALFLILSELFNNALDHGVLQLDSMIKHGADGFEAFLQLRECRLSALDCGKIDIEIEKVVIEGADGVRIRVVDSGNGFDYSALQTDVAGPPEHAQYGRGVALVKSLAYKLEFAQRGNEVIVYYVCS